MSLLITIRRLIQANQMNAKNPHECLASFIMTSLYRPTPRHLQLLVHPYICTLITYFSRRCDNLCSQGPFKKIYNFVHTAMNITFRTLNTTPPQPRNKMSHDPSDTSSKIHHQHTQKRPFSIHHGAAGLNRALYLHVRDRKEHASCVAGWSHLTRSRP